MQGARSAGASTLTSLVGLPAATDYRVTPKRADHTLVVCSLHIAAGTSRGKAQVLNDDDMICEDDQGGASSVHKHRAKHCQQPCTSWVLHLRPSYRAPCIHELTDSLTPAASDSSYSLTCPLGLQCPDTPLRAVS